MDPSFNGEWSASEIETVKSHIAGNNTNTYANNMNKKHTDIMDELQAIFPLKEKHQVTNLYVELMMEMMHRMQGGNQHVVTNNNIMIGNFGTPLEDPSMGNMEVLCDPLMEEMEAIRKGVEVPQRHPMPQKEKQHAVRFWTKEEHRKFLKGLDAYGRGSWKNISRHFLPNKTPVQICSHAQKYFRRLQNPNKKQRYSINDVGLYDTELGVQNNASGWEGHTITGGAYNPNHYGSGDQPAAMNNLSQVTSPLMHITGQASSSQTATLANGSRQQMGASSSSVVPLMEGAGSHMGWTDDQQGDFFANQWIMNMHMN
ncbi:hypothetical protein PAHAL_4G279300 [Panicum hallii]|uniref:Uncharacterized protein n=1 Tax=Panicum hallii TaxID=206008 RepID=A0A2S3HKS5_9POAL|nr:myb-like protein H [Panicum hallii]PAN25147.1 hypothetical protein PAHAL_4G279300 [Panicum hallii]